VKVYNFQRDERGQPFCRISGGRLPYALALRPDLKTYGLALDWGTGLPSDSARLSLALLVDHFEGDARAPSRLGDALAVCLHLSFSRWVAGWPTESFQVDAAEIRAQLRELVPLHVDALREFIGQCYVRDRAALDRPSHELLRFRYITLFLVGLGVPAAFAQELFRLSTTQEHAKYVTNES